MNGKPGAQGGQAQGDLPAYAAGTAYHQSVLSGKIKIFFAAENFHTYTITHLEIL
jgi:hypothetical protein